jgi:hypothetical protein
MAIKLNVLSRLHLFVQSFLFIYLFKDIKLIFLELLRNRDSLGVLDITNTNFFLPKKVKKFSVVRSPTTSKLSKEQFEFCFFKACLLFNFTQHIDFLIFKSLVFNLDLKYSYFKFSCYSDLKNAEV